LPWRLLAVGWFERGVAIEQMRLLRTHMQRFEFASCVAFADPDSQASRQGVLFRVASSEAPPLDAVLALEHLMGITPQGGLRYVDARPVHLRSLRLSPSADGQDSQLDAFILAGDTRAEVWLKQLLQTSQPVRALGRRLLMTGHEPPSRWSRLVRWCAVAWGCGIKRFRIFWLAHRAAKPRNSTNCNRI